MQKNGNLQMVTNFLKHLVVFAGFALFAVVACIALWTYLLPPQLQKNTAVKGAVTGFMTTRLAEADTTKHPDVLVIGSSHAYRGFDPRIFSRHGVRLFNLGSSAQTPIQSEFLLRRYLQTIQPEFVLFEVYPQTFTSDGLESTLDLLTALPRNKEVSKMALQTANVRAINTLIGTWVFGGANLYMNSVEPGKRSKDTYIAGGFVESPVVRANPTPQPKSPWEFEAAQIQAFKRCLELIENSKIPYLLVQTPVSRAKLESHSNWEYADSLFAASGEYINLNNSIELVDSLHFYDDNHLNQDGVELMNELFLSKHFLSVYKERIR